MRRYTRRGRSRPAQGGSGSFWLCFSDLMSALLLVFVLVMFYSVYQYLDMMEVKTAELMRQSGLLDQKQAELSEKDKALTEKDEALKSSQGKLTESEQAMVTQQAKLLLFEKELNSSEELLSNQRAELSQKSELLASQQQKLDAQAELLASQQAQMAEQKRLLGDQQTAMDQQQQTLSSQQTLLSDAQAQLLDQQNQMAQQQEKLDALVGVRARIIASLAKALSDAQVRAKVDAKSGSIALDASVLFDVGQSELKESGKRVLDEFLPVYLSVLMDGENSGNISEIIIEGHTDTDGTYMKNLKLSQERALSVMEYILDDNYRMITGGMKRKLRQIATANGRSFSNPIYDVDGGVDKTASRRVEFKFRMQDEQMIEDMRAILND